VPRLTKKDEDVPLNRGQASTNEAKRSGCKSWPRARARLDLRVVASAYTGTSTHPSARHLHFSKTIQRLTTSHSAVVHDEGLQLLNILLTPVPRLFSPPSHFKRIGCVPRQKGDRIASLREKDHFGRDQQEGGKSSLRSRKNQGVAILQEQEFHSSLTHDLLRRRTASLTTPATETPNAVADHETASLAQVAVSTITSQTQLHHTTGSRSIYSPYLVTR
jgi:hypothetical protein